MSEIVLKEYTIIKGGRMKTTIHYYWFNLDKPEQAAEYEALRARLADRKCFNVHRDPKKWDPEPGSEEVELLTEHLFNNQWNTATARVFDWYEGIVPNCRIKIGHYLEITPEMREIRRNTLKCGYCGKMEPAAKGYTFCPHCLGSQHLKATELHSTRLLPVESCWGPREPLTDAERERLLPEYQERQAEIRARLAAKKRAQLMKDRDDAIEEAEVKAVGFLWILDHGLDTENVIYYSHQDRFCFGWRQPLTADEVSALLDVISEFPFPYKLKGESRTWEGG